MKKFSQLAIQPCLAGRQAFSHLAILFLLTFSYLLLTSSNDILAVDCGNFEGEIEYISCPTGCHPEYSYTANGDMEKIYICVGDKSLKSEDKGTIYNPALNKDVGSGDVGESIIAKILAAIIRLFFIAGSIAVLVYFLIGGLAWITSEGDKGKMEIAKNRLTFAGIGIVIIAATYAILQILGSFLGIKFFEKLIIDWPTLTGP